MLALFALGICCIISVDLVSGGHCSGRLGVAEEFLDFSGRCLFLWVQCLFDSGYMLCVITLVASDVFHTFSTLRRTRILKCFFSLFSQRSVPSRRFWLQSCSAQLALGNLEVLLELHAAAMRDQGQHFWGTCVSHRWRGAGPTRESDSGLAGTHAN